MLHRASIRRARSDSGVQHYGVYDGFLEQVTLLFRERHEAEEVVAERDRDVPEQAG